MSHRGHREAWMVSIIASQPLQHRHPVVGREPADRVRERGATFELAALGAPEELPHALDDLRQARGRERMTARLETAGRIDREAAIERRLAVECRATGLPDGDQPDVFERDQLEGGE